ncbi:MAG: heme-binding domain-containing protein [Chloroflexi bacterium]|nr:heme-binding domain-containing protein [Chloroflexota bacterium]
MKRLILLIVILAAIGFVAIQFIPVDRTNPPVTREIAWNSPETRALAQRACFDCHSNETVWPFYSYIAPISLMLAEHVADGRDRLNFSEWDGRNEDFDDIAEVVTSGKMPLPTYLLLHPEARLSEAEKQGLLEGLALTYEQDPPR